MKKILLILLFPILCFSQNPGFELLKKINGVEVFYKKSKTKDGDKKDTWLIEFEFNNVSGKDIFYKTVLKDPESISKLLGDNDKEEIFNFATILIENAKKLSFVSDTNTKLSGDKTRLTTDKKENLYIIKKGKTYTKTMDFRAEKGIEPVISLQIINSISFTDDLNDFL